VQYEGWLYEQIKDIVNQYKEVGEAADSLVREKEKEMENEHQRNVERENRRRKEILD
jgi:hypothetical protein